MSGRIPSSPQWSCLRERKTSAKSERLNKVLKNFRETPLSRTIGSRGREIVKDYVKSDGIDPLDAMIAAAAIIEGLTLSTRNRKHFRHIRGLKIETPSYS